MSCENARAGASLSTARSSLRIVTRIVASIAPHDRRSVRVPIPTGRSCPPWLLSNDKKKKKTSLIINRNRGRFESRCENTEFNPVSGARRAARIEEAADLSDDDDDDGENRSFDSSRDFYLVPVRRVRSLFSSATNWYVTRHGGKEKKKTKGRTVPQVH